MREAYLGDSYDLVKRFWYETLKSLALLYAHPRFIPSAIHAQYTAITSIPILDVHPIGQFGILFDPHTGIPLPTESTRRTNTSHATLQFMVQTANELRPLYMICFDQSYHRQHELSREQQRASKRQLLQAQGIASFYYVSHAPFLFMAREVDALQVIRDRLVSLGIPPNRLEY